MRSIVHLATGVLLLGIAAAHAADPFTLTAGSNLASVSVSNNNVIDLTGDLIDSRNEFATLAGQSVTGSLRYGGMQDAVLFSRNASGTSATITIPSTGFTRTFTGANDADVRDQIEDFFRGEGADEYARFLREVNRRTTLGVADGNPLSATALMADRSFYRFGFQSPRFDLGEGPRMPSGFGLDLTGGSSESDDGDGWFAQLGTGTAFRLGDRFALSFNLDARYRDVEGASVYQIVSTIGLPIMIVPPPRGDGISWTVTPAFVIGFGGSWDLAAGGFPIGGQITSSLAARVDDWAFVLANQYGFYDGLPIDISDFRFETDINQSILKNGVQVIRRFGRGFVDAGIAYTNFLDDAAVDDYWSPEVGIGTRWETGSGVRVGYRGDFGDGFTNHGVVAQLFIAF